MSDLNPSVRLHATVEGRVQGVGFRAFVEQVAAGLGVSGWVRNRWDGSVELVAEGDRSQLEKLLDALRAGPRMSNVETVIHEWQAASGEFRRFSVKSSG